MFALTVRNIRAHKRRLAGTGLAVLLGVAFLSSTLVMGDTLRQSFRGIYDELTAGTDVIVRNENVVGSAELAERGPVDAELVDRLAAVEGVAAAANQIEGSVQIVSSEGDAVGGNGPPVLAYNWVEDEALNPLVIRDGRAPEAADEVVIDRAGADQADLVVGDTVTVRTPAPVEVELVGTITVGDLDSTSGATIVAFDTTTAIELMGDPGEVSSVAFRAEPGVSAELLRDRLAAELDPGFEALTGSELSAEFQADIESDFLGVVNTALLGFAGIALLVAGFSIHNTFSIIVAQRSRESALLRALGASRGQVLGSIALEALAIGTVASATGLAAGIGLAAGLKALLSAVGMELVVSSVVVKTSALVVAMLVGVAVTLISALVPSIKASRVAPIAALRDLAVDQGVVSVSRVVSGVGLTGTGVALVIAGALADGGSASLAGIGAAITVIGTIALGPAVARPAISLIGTPLAITGGTTGRIARRNAARNPRRTAGSASALLVGVAVVALMATMGASIKTSIDQVVDRTFGGDLVADPGWGSAGLAPELAAEIEALDEVETSVGVSAAIMNLDGRQSSPVATEPAVLDRIVDLEVIEGSVRDIGRGELAVSEAYAEAHDLAMGSTLTGSFADGSDTELTVAAIYGERALMGDLIMSDLDWAPHAGSNPRLQLVMIDLADGVSLTTGQQAVQRVSDDHSGPTVQNRDEYVDMVASEIDQLLYMVYGLLGLAVLIALMGIANTMALAIHERTRELGLLRAVGQSRRQLRATVRWESVITALFGAVGGIGLGTFLGWGLVKAVTASEGLGTVSVPTATLAAVTLIAAMAGVLAAVRPARRAARLDILEAVATS